MGKRREQKESGPSRDVLLQYIREIDRFAEQLRDTQERIGDLQLDCQEKRDAHEAAKAAVKEEKEIEHATVTMLLKFVAPGSLETFPLFDTMAPADEEEHGRGAGEWRKEPITALRLSAVAMQCLVAADIVLIGQLQDAIQDDPEDWWTKVEGVTSGMADAVQVKYEEYVAEQVKK